MNHLSIDLETYSDIDIKKAGLYKYVQSPAFEILLCGYSVNGQPVCVLDLTAPREREYFERMFKELLFAGDTIIHAYNASFEALCLARHFGIDTARAPGYFSRFRCTMLHGLYCGYPAGLDLLGQALGLPQDKRKLSVGASLIRTFCAPCKPSKANGCRSRTLPRHEPEKWRLFKEYCAQDVVAEMEIERRLSAFPVPEEIQRQWELDQVINARGVRVDRELVDGALDVDAASASALTAEAVRISGLENPNSVKQLTEWLAAEGEEAGDLRKETVRRLIHSTNNDLARRVLEIRQELSKTSVKKYAAMKAAVCGDGRIRGLLQFYGANRTGRWAGRLVQVQNLPKNHDAAINSTMDYARQAVKRRDIEALRLMYGSVSDTLSQLVRTAFIPSEGRVLLVADFSAIEARVIAWLAGEQWRQEVFATHGKIYEASASAMFGVPIERIVKGNPEYELRQKGKVAELALGYQGGVGALVKMGALDMGLSEEELPEIVRRWRQANRRITDLWYAVESAAVEAVRAGGPTAVRGVLFAREGDFSTGQDFLTVTLPSGRKLYYARPFLSANNRGVESLHYWGMDQETKKWSEVDTYGGKLVENIVQAIARDCLAEALTRLETAGFEVVMHVHDEVVIDAPEGASVEDACRIMGAPMPWAPGLLLRADGWTGKFYRKD